MKIIESQTAWSSFLIQIDPLMAAKQTNKTIDNAEYIFRGQRLN